jgi:hypothetical protein
MYDHQVLDLFSWGWGALPPYPHPAPLRLFDGQLLGLLELGGQWGALPPTTALSHHWGWVTANHLTC